MFITVSGYEMSGCGVHKGLISGDCPGQAISKSMTDVEASSFPSFSRRAADPSRNQPLPSGSKASETGNPLVLRPRRHGFCIPSEDTRERPPKTTQEAQPKRALRQ